MATEIIHITFEKITGLKGTFEGDFICEDFHKLDKRLPLIFNAFIVSKGEFVFVQDGRYFYMRPVNPGWTLNYVEHFYYGVNFLIKEWSNGGGGIKINSQNLN